MELTVKEIYDTLQARPDILELFKLIDSLDDDARKKAIAFALSYFNSIS